MLGHNWHASQMPFLWSLASRPMMARLWWYLDPTSPHQLKKKRCQSGPPLTKLSGSAHETHHI